jgi:hypothetical protein
MKNARPIQDETSAADQGAVIVAPGSLPIRQNTVTADVLARLLAHERLTGLDAVTDSSTTRLAAVVEYLAKRYNWTICRYDKVTGCNDGRVTTVSVYYLLSGVIELAAAAGSAGWCVEVRAARLKLRANAAEAKRIAERANKSRQRLPRVQHAGQRGLFDGEGVLA